MPPGMRRLFEQQYAEDAQRKALELQPAPQPQQKSLAEPALTVAFRPYAAMNVGADAVALADLNKTEKRYYEILKTRPDLVWIGVHTFRLRLAANTHYTPDFTTLDTQGVLTMIDTKGAFTWEDAQLKMKLAARLFPFFRFVKAVVNLRTKKRPESLVEHVLKA